MGERRAVLILLLILCLVASIVYLPHIRVTEDSWKAREPMPTARLRLAVAVVDDKLYAIGGATIFRDFIGKRDFVGPPFSTNEQYTPATYIPEFPSWTAPLITLVILVAAAVVYRHKLKKQRRFDDF